MCGIAAIFSIRPFYGMRTELDRMLNTIANRGPDGRGVLLGNNTSVFSNDSEQVPTWGLGHVRLAILDLTDSGKQPMRLKNNRLWIAYNGEVYNYLELRKELLDLGVIFKGSSDTEVVLAAYNNWGPSCVNRFNGMFALIIVDFDKKEVFAARDRFGIKPLYLCKYFEKLFVVSEIKELLATEGFQPKVNRGHVVDFILDGAVNHYPDECFFNGVTPLPPGHWLKWNMDELPDMANCQSYWSPTPGTRSRSITWNEAVETTAEIFMDAVKIRLRSDVPVGSCLSGGVDSSSIVGMVCNNLGHNMSTFTSCVPGTDLDEEKYARVVSEKCGTRFIKVTPTIQEAIDFLDSLIYSQDEPFTSLSVLAQTLIMKKARELNIPVLLDGQGGDELLCGYRKYAWFYASRLLKNRRYLQAMSHISKVLWNGDRSVVQFSKGAAYFPIWLRSDSGNLRDMLRPGYKDLASTPRSISILSGTGLAKHRVADLTRWSLPSLLRYEDRNSMAHSIETRLPFLDSRLAEFLLDLPEEFVFKQGRTKRLLVEAMGNALPHEIKCRRTKLGFETAEDQWMKSELGLILERKVRDSYRLDEIMDRQAAADSIVRYRVNKKRNSRQTRAVWRIACLAMWMDKFQVEN